MRISTWYRLVTIVSVLGATAACAAIEAGDISLRPRAGKGGVAPVGGPGARGFPRPDSGGVGRINDPHSSLIRRVCRASGWSRDWIATAYEEAAGGCPRRTGADSSAVAAILIRLDAQPIGAVLDVCADQTTPGDWIAERPESSEVSQRCPGAGRDGASAMKRIRRVR